MYKQSEIQLTVDGIPVIATDGQSILEASLGAGIYIPHLCHHPALRAQGGCKLCSVEIEGIEGTVTSCTTIVVDGMKVNTKTGKLSHLRQVATELLLACHPADCTSCKAYLNCELQALLQYLGVAHSRLRRVEKQNIGIANSFPNGLMKREMERCIQCGRCVRACEELRGVGALVYGNKNGESYVGVKSDMSLLESDCRFCGACVEVCPTGAIQDITGVFKTNIPKEQSLVPCKNSCPAHTDVPTYIKLIEEKRYAEAVSVIREKLTFPHVLGYVCEHKCEYDCKRNYLDNSISIREAKKFAVENDTEMLWKQKVEYFPPTGKRIAIIGAGPTGMTAAWHLARKGHSITVVEKQSSMGGMMRYGIPEYRLKREILDNEIRTIKDIGMTIIENTTINSVLALLAADYDAVLIAVGAQKGTKSYLGTDDCKNVWSAVDFCRFANKDEMPNVGKSLTIIGGGNVAFDCARLAKKAGVEKVRLVCLEARENMLADIEEVEEAILEGVEVINSFSTTSIEKQDDIVTILKGVKVKSFKFGEKGLELESEPDSEQTFQITGLVLAIGQQIDLNEEFGVALGNRNSVIVDQNMQSSVLGVFAAGDVVTGTKSIVEAIASASKVAIYIDKYLGGNGVIDEQYFERTYNESIGIIENFSHIEKKECILSCDEATTQTKRCLQCDLRLQIPKVKFWGDPQYKQGKKGII